jgi:Tol biopolymer transport system component/serine/threonine protein kinase
VPEPRAPQSVVRFEGFELDLRSGELRRDGGKTIRLSEQPFRILVLLLERPLEVVTREELRKKLWPHDTIVEFEHSISAAMNRLRQALGDSAEKPRYIETLARRGYRWMVPVQREPSVPALAAATVSTAAVSPENLIGKKVSHYRVLELLGAGGMGVVYKAEDIKLGRRVALKFLPEELTKDPVALGRFEREARSASSLDHPNICAVHEFDEYDGQPFIVMQLLEGQTLRECIAAATGRAAIPFDELIGVAIQISEGLEAAHRKGIIHRDIKPANIFITTRGEAKILDFGLAKLHGTTQDVNTATVTQDMKGPTAVDMSGMPTSSAAALALSKTGQTMGTASYMSPEQVRCEELDGRTDLFSLGLVLYEMGTSQQAFAGSTAAVLHDAILHHTPTSARVLNPNLPRRFDEIITKCIQKDRELRYQSAGELATDLKHLRLHVGGAKRLWLEKFKSRRVIELAAAAVVLLLLTLIWRFSAITSDKPLGPVEVVPLVGVPAGHQRMASFSPDGNQLVFDQGGDQFCNRDKSCGIYTTLIDGEKSLRLTHNETDCCPRWSPDGRQIAFSRQVDGGTAVFLISALGGTERRLYVGPVNYYDGYLDWSPDGQILAITQTSPGKNTGRIALLSVADSTTTPLTNPPGQYIDYGPVFSPDGSVIAFNRRTNAGIDADVFVVPIIGGNPKRLTVDSRQIDDSPTWSADGRDVLFSSFRKGLPTLWRVSASGGAPRPVAGVGTMAYCPSVSRKGHQLVYENRLRDDNIWRVKLRDETHIRGSPSVLISSNVGINWRPDFSPDGKRIAFESSRSGYAEVWACDTDGTNCSSLTSLHGIAGTPRWSPDGRHISFEFHRGGHSEIYVLEVGGGPPQLMPTRPGADNVAPSWSRDGQWIYFASDHGEGQFQLWKVRLQGGSPIQVTRNGGVYGVESADQKFLYYAKWETNGIWRMPLPDGQETHISGPMDSTGGSDWYNWALARNGIYFLNRAAEPKEAIEYFDLATSKTTTISVPDRRVDFGVTLSPDERSLVYAQNDVYQSNLVLMKNFQ